VVARVGSLAEREERRRRKCLELFIPTLVGLGVTDLKFESRGAKPDRLDLDMIRALRASQRVSSLLRIDHVPGPNDPLLWAADALCGAAVAARIGNPHWLETMKAASAVTVVEIAG